MFSEILNSSNCLTLAGRSGRGLLL